MEFPMFNGFTAIYLKDNMVEINHAGNMGNTVDRHVRPAVNFMLGQDAFDNLQKAGKEKGAPDYLYTLRIPKAKFDAIVK